MLHRANSFLIFGFELQFRTSFKKNVVFSFLYPFPALF